MVLYIPLCFALLHVAPLFFFRLDFIARLHNYALHSYGLHSYGRRSYGLVSAWALPRSFFRLYLSFYFFIFEAVDFPHFLLFLQSFLCLFTPFLFSPYPPLEHSAHLLCVIAGFSAVLCHVMSTH